MSGCLHFDEGRRWISLSEMKSASAETCRPFTFYLRIEGSLLASEAVVALACRERGRIIPAIAFNNSICGLLTI